MVFKSNLFALACIIKFNPCIIRGAIVLGKIDFIEVAKYSLIHVIASVDVHAIAVNDCSVVWAIGYVFTGDFDLGPSGVEMVEVVSFNSERLALGRGEVFALVCGAVGFHFYEGEWFLFVKLKLLIMIYEFF